MGIAWRYWRWVNLDPAQGRAVKTLAPARDYFHQQFGRCTEDEEVSDKACQIRLIQQRKDSPEPLSPRLAEVCLRCFISCQIDWICNNLAQKFGDMGGFDHYDLLPLVLDDVGVADLVDGAIAPTSYISLATRILQSFDPDKAQLSTWCRQMVVSHPELSAFLKESGIVLESDWSLLNNMGSAQLRRILLRNEVSSQDVDQALALLESYQLIYRGDRLHQQQTKKTRGRCRPPTTEQLDRILADLQSKGYHTLRADAVLDRLQAIAQYIRQSRRPQTVSWDQQVVEPVTDTTDDEENIFLQQYRQVYLKTLKEAIAQVVEQRVAYRQRKRKPDDQAFLLALRLFTCEKLSMGAIAAQVQLKEQYQVTRLLELKEFRADVRRSMLVLLRDRIRELAGDYIDPARLHRIDVTLDAALEVEVDAMISAAEKEASTAHCSRKTLFTEVLCQHLDNKE